MRKRSRSHQEPTPAARRILRATHLVLSLAAGAALGGCPGGAELENPDRFRQYDAGFAGVGGATGGGAVGGAGAPQGGSAGSVAGGGAGTAGGAGSGTWTWNCPEPLEGTTGALARNCAFIGCHNALYKEAGLDLTNPSTIAAQMVDKVAVHAVNCNPPGMPFRLCTAEELAAKGCPTDVKLIDSANFDNSWVVAKINQTHGECGLYMPYDPGNSAARGWDAAGRRKQCYLDFFRSLVAPR